MNARTIVDFPDLPNAPVDEPGVSAEDFRAYMPTHQYLYVPTRELWSATSIDSRLGKISGVPASTWLDKYRAVEQMVWMPGAPMILSDTLFDQGGRFERTGATSFNLYRPPNPKPGDANEVAPWLDHVARIYPDDVAHLVNWLAHRVQHPGEKPNHAIVLGGGQGIGKDTLLEPVKYAVGPWNFVDVSPGHLLGRFNGFVKSVVLRISEARDLGDIDRYAFYDHLKIYTAAPPDVIRCDEKNLREHNVANVCGVIITTNHKSDGIFLPSDDRRHYVAWSGLSKEDFAPDYWQKIYRWYESGGLQHVAAYLAQVDLSGFDPKAPPPKTAAWYEIVDANRSPENAEMSDILDSLKHPDALTLTDVIAYASESFGEWLQDRRNRRQIPHRLEDAGYVPVRNDADVRDGQWRVGTRRQTIYAKKTLPRRDQIAAAASLCRKVMER